MAPGRRPGPSGIDADELPGRSRPRVARPDTGVAVRLPTLEVFAALNGAVLSGQGRPLSPREIDLARPVFGESVRFQDVRVVVAPIANSPVTLGNVVRVASTSGIHSRQMDDATLIHELTHVWQFQTRGMRYMSNSLCHQVAATLSSGSRSEAYRLRRSDVVRAGTIDNLPAEKQATLVEFWFAENHFYAEEGSSAPPMPVREEPLAESMLAEVRRARPLPQSYILEEAAWGAGAHTQRLLDPSHDSPQPIPWIRIEF
jgi:hypothetical protein